MHNYPGATADLTLQYTYSAAHQLTNAFTSESLNRHVVSGSNGTQSYTGANELNQYPSITPIGGALTAIAYDANGNLTSDGVNTFAYDPENRLLSVSGGASATYAYDALDRRMSKTAGGVTTRYLQAGADEIAEYNSAGTLLRRFVPGPGTDERAVWIESTSTSPPATALNFPHTDRLGSVLAITSNLLILARSIWIVSRYWMDYLSEFEGREEITWPDQERGIQHHYALLLPCLTADAKREFRSALAQAPRQGK